MLKVFSSLDPVFGLSIQATVEHLLTMNSSKTAANLWERSRSCEINIVSTSRMLPMFCYSGTYASLHNITYKLQFYPLYNLLMTNTINELW